MSSLHSFLLGVVAMGSWTVAIFFLRFWKLSGERLFLFFAGAFVTLSIDWIALAILNPVTQTRHYFFAVRLVAFALIIVGIIDKNGRRPSS